jgi:predicted enzyme related to lactoylglutathione lyase
MANSNVGRFVWHDHLTRNPKAAIAFYTEVLGWKTQPYGAGDAYTMWVGSQGPLGGTMGLSEEQRKTGLAPYWMGHVQVENVDRTAEQAAKLGGKIEKEPTDIPAVGRFAVIADPQKATLSIFTPKDAMKLHDDTKEGEFCWAELMTSNQGAALEFYSQLFGWKKTSEIDMGERVGAYVAFGIGTKQIGGIMNQPKGMPFPPMWVYYVQTADLEAALGRASGHGGTVMNGPMEVPGGRIAQLMDPEGAMFALHESA